MRDTPEAWESRRRRMLTQDLQGRDIEDPRVLKVLGELPREEFVPRLERPAAYADRALRLGRGQTISQPYVVAFMTQALQVEEGMRVLEIGTGSGYQTAVLALLGAEVFSMEVEEDLSLVAEQTLDRLGLGERVTLRVDDGGLGWPEEAPFPRIIVTAASPRPPPALLDQLAPGGRMVLPVGEREGGQTLCLVEKPLVPLPGAPAVSLSPLLKVMFVPLRGKAGYV